MSALCWFKIELDRCCWGGLLCLGTHLALGIGHGKEWRTIGDTARHSTGAKLGKRRTLFAHFPARQIVSALINSCDSAYLRGTNIDKQCVSDVRVRGGEGGCLCVSKACNLRYTMFIVYTHTHTHNYTDIGGGPRTESKHTEGANAFSVIYPSAFGSHRGRGIGYLLLVNVASAVPGSWATSAVLLRSFAGFFFCYDRLLWWLETCTTELGSKRIFHATRERYGLSSTWWCWLHTFV